MSEENRKAAYRWVADTIGLRLAPPAGPLPFPELEPGVRSEVLRIRSALRAASNVPLSPVVGAGPEPGVSAGVPPPAGGTPPAAGAVEPFREVSCDDIVRWLNMDQPQAEPAFVRSCDEHLVDCGLCGVVAELRKLADLARLG